MTAAVVVLVVGLAGALMAGISPTQEMWAPLLVSITPLVTYMMWPRRDRDVSVPAAASKRAA